MLVDQYFQRMKFLKRITILLLRFTESSLVKITEGYIFNFNEDPSTAVL